MPLFEDTACAFGARTFCAFALRLKGRCSASYYFLYDQDNDKKICALAHVRARQSTPKVLRARAL
jgi:hypothetical protein